MGHDRAPEPKILLKLYVTGTTSSAQKAKSAISDLIQSNPDANIQLKVIDVLSDPEGAMTDNVFATPTVIRSGMGLERRLVGDLSSVEKLQIGLLIDLAT